MNERQTSILERRQRLLSKIPQASEADRFRQLVEEELSSLFYTAFQNWYQRLVGGESKAPSRYIIQHARDLAYEDVQDDLWLQFESGVSSLLLVGEGSEECLYECASECLKKWRQTGNEEKLNWRHTEYARILKRAPRTGVPWTAVDRFFATLRAFQFSCAYCNGRFDQVDHFIPLARLGANHESNLVPACEACNLSKGDKEPMEWCYEKFGAVGFYSVRREAARGALPHL